MTDAEKLSEAVDILLENILTPIVYMYVDEVTEFIVFCGADIPEEVFRTTEKTIYFNLGLNVEIIDLREFSESDRVDIARNAFVVYEENELMTELFETAALSDVKAIEAAKKELMTRKNDTGTYYMS